MVKKGHSLIYLSLYEMSEEHGTTFPKFQPHVLLRRIFRPKERDLC